VTGDRDTGGIVRWASVLNLALQLALLVMSPTLVVTGATRRHTSTEATFAVVAGAALAALHLRHVRAAARGERPAAWPLTLAAQAVLAYAPLPWLGLDWVSSSLPLTASTMLLLPRPWRMTVGFTVPYLVSGTASCFLMYRLLLAAHTLSFWHLLSEMVYYAITWAVFSLVLYGTARLVRLVGELYRSRAELAELAVDEERVRVSRDLHDLLGQSLSAISLKGDLAARLLSVDPSRARHELTSLTELARSTLRDVRDVARDEHQVTLREEIAAAQGLLAAAGVATRIDAGDAGRAPPGAAQQVLAWAVREGITNLLRHSEATTCTIALARAGGVISLDIRNDGVRQPLLGDGSGLAGLKDRAAGAGGSASGRSSGDGHFHLHVELPDADALVDGRGGQG
jgi:two-component system sensor histidine kinase DesK